ncbi:EAL domain-containing protein [Vibrio sp. 10N.286.52.C3]|uniref:EAL domain-containing protein n=1 Tax=Vibrio sp. 10N.286.52.C3 TaxID=3229713 RepID=UPI00354BB692
MTLTSVYQPIYDSNNKKIGLEALVRATDSTGKSIPPNAIFHNESIAERDLANISNLCQLIHLKNFATARQKSKKNWLLFLNLSPTCCEDIAIGSINDFYKKRFLRSLNMRANNIIMEFIETPYDSNYILGVASQQLKNDGFKVAFDDFSGTDSDHERLSQISPDIVKLNMSLLNRYMSGDKSPLMRSIKSAKLIGAKTLIEGIETRDALMSMKKLDIDYFQGYFLGRPEPLKPK